MVSHQFICFVLFTLISMICAAQLKHPFKQCSPRSTGEVTDVTVNAPCQDGYCTFYKGADARLGFTFTLRKKAQKLRAKVTATVGTTDHELALPNQDVCKQLGCPLKNGVSYSYNNNMLVSLTYPSVKVNQMRYSLVDGKGRELICISVPVIIAEKEPKQ